MAKNNLYFAADVPEKAIPYLEGRATSWYDRVVVVSVVVEVVSVVKFLGGVSLILFSVYSLISFPVFPPIVRFPTTCASLMIVFAISVQYWSSRSSAVASSVLFFTSSIFALLIVTGKQIGRAHV